MKKVVLLLVGLLMLVAVPVTVFLANQRQELRKKAAPATTLSFSPGSLTKKVGDEFKLDITVDTAENQVVAGELHITYDPAKLEAKSLVNSASLFPLVLTASEIEAGTATITIGAASATDPVTGTGVMATITFKALENTEAPTAVKFAESTFIGGLGEGANNILVGSTPANITISSSGTSTRTTITPVPTKSAKTTTGSKTAVPPSSSKLPLTITPTLSATDSAAVASTSAVAIVSLVPEEEVTTDTPVVSGIAAPGSTVTVVFYSEPQTCVTTADTNGNWSCEPTTPLEDGPHDVVVTASAPSGTTTTANQSFVIASGGDAVGSQSAIPVSGDTENTILALSVGIALLILGIGLPLVWR